MKNREMMKREIHGMLPTGERVFLGAIELDYQEVCAFLNNVSETYAGDVPGWFNVASNVYKTQSFIGVEVTPMCY